MQHATEESRFGHFISHQRGHGAPFVYVADHGLSSAVWRATADRLAPESERLEVDLAGSGRGPAVPRQRPEGPEPTHYDVAVQALALYRIIQALELPPFVVVGHGFGALVAERFALQYQDCLLGVALVSPLHSPSDQWRQALIAADAHALTYRTLSAEALGLFRAHAAAAPESWEAVLPQLRSVAHDDELATLEIPVLLISGDHAPFTSLPRLATLAQRLRQGSLCVLDQVGHLPMLEAPDRLSEALRRFAASCPGRRHHMAPGAWNHRMECAWPETALRAFLAAPAEPAAPAAGVETLSPVDELIRWQALGRF